MVVRMKQGRRAIELMQFYDDKSEFRLSRAFIHCTSRLLVKRIQSSRRSPS